MHYGREGADFTRMCHISLLWWFEQVVTFWGLLWRKISSISSGYERLMEMVSLRGFKFYRLWKFRDTHFFGVGRQRGLYRQKPFLFHALWLWRRWFHLDVSYFIVMVICTSSHILRFMMEKDVFHFFWLWTFNENGLFERF